MAFFGLWEFERKSASEPQIPKAAQQRRTPATILRVRSNPFTSANRSHSVNLGDVLGITILVRCYRASGFEGYDWKIQGPTPR